MDKVKTLLRSGGRHWWFWMGIALYILSLVPAVTQHTIPRRIYWLAALICIVIAFYQTWSEQYDRAEAYKREVDEIYADVVLDFLMQHHLKTFPIEALANMMRYDVRKVLRGLRVLEEEFQVVRDEGAIGWTFDAERTFSRGMYCNLRRLVPRDSN